MKFTKFTLIGVSLMAATPDKVFDARAGSCQLNTVCAACK